MADICTGVVNGVATATFVIPNIEGRCIELLDWDIISLNGSRWTSPAPAYITVNSSGNLVSVDRYELSINVEFVVAQAFSNPLNRWLISFTVQRCDCSDRAVTCEKLFMAAPLCDGPPVGDPYFICPDEVRVSSPGNSPPFWIPGTMEILVDDGDGFARFSRYIQDSDADEFSVDNIAFMQSGEPIPHSDHIFYIVGDIEVTGSKYLRTQRLVTFEVPLLFISGVVDVVAYCNDGINGVTETSFQISV